MFFSYIVPAFEAIKRDVSIFEGEKYPTLCSISRLVTTLNVALEMRGPPTSWNLGILMYA